VFSGASFRRRDARSRADTATLRHVLTGAAATSASNQCRCSGVACNETMSPIFGGVAVASMRTVNSMPPTCP
jgi:hypothetical protein